MKHRKFKICYEVGTWNHPDSDSARRRYQQTRASGEVVVKAPSILAATMVVTKFLGHSHYRISGIYVEINNTGQWRSLDDTR